LPRKNYQKISGSDVTEAVGTAGRVFASLDPETSYRVPGFGRYGASVEAYLGVKVPELTDLMSVSGVTIDKA
jgi:hypothetical protein